MNSAASPAVVAKIRALHGKRILSEQYKDLLNCNSVSDVAAYLKSSTSYADALQNISESTIHRGELELMVHRKNVELYATLYHYLNPSGDNLFHYIIEEFEIREIMRMIMLLKAGNPETYIMSLPGFLFSLCKVDLMALAKVRTFDQLLRMLSETKYAEILKQFRPSDENSSIDYVKCEHAMYENYFRRLLHMIDRSTKGTERLELKRLIGMRIDQINIRNIYRAKIILHADTQEVVSRIFPFHKRLTRRMIDELVSAPSDEQTRKLIKDWLITTNIFNNASQNFDLPLESYTQHLRYHICKNLLHLSQNVSTVFFSYFVLSQLEVSNLIYIIEGIRYKISKEEIENLIVQ